VGRNEEDTGAKDWLRWSDWTRIGDNDVASFGKHTFRFEAAEGYYFVVADETDQYFVQVSHHNDLGSWPIYQSIGKQTFSDCVA